MDKSKDYPDISDILTRKERGRTERARLGFGEKLDILDKLKNQLAPVNAARQQRAKRGDRKNSSRV